MAWVRTALVENEYVAEENHEAKRLMSELRAKRRAHGAAVFGRYVAKALVGDGPWDLDAFSEGWALVAFDELRSNDHMGKRPRPLDGFGAVWVKRQLGALGYEVRPGKRVALLMEVIGPDGKPRMVAQRDRGTGAPMFGKRSNLIHRNPDTI